jgi:hypothetical protein
MEVSIDLTEPLKSKDDEEEETQFILDLYDEAKKRNKRDGDYIYMTDLLYDAIPRMTSDQILVWWIAEDHPLVIMLKHNHHVSDGGMYGSLGNVDSPLGKIIIYADIVMQEAVETVVNLCVRLNLKIYK